jgi:hypothetical protein
MAVTASLPAKKIRKSLLKKAGSVSSRMEKQLGSPKRDGRGRRQLAAKGNRAMKKLIFASVVAITLAAISVWAQDPTTIAQWTFETSKPTTAGPISPEVGSGQAIGHHAGTTAYSAPAGDLDATIAAMDPGGPPSPGTSGADAAASNNSYSSNGWAVNDYWQFEVSTVGLSGIEIGWDQAGSNTGPKNFQLQYSIDDSTWTTVGSAYSVVLSTWNATTAAGYSSGVISEPDSAWNNQATLYFQLVDTSTTSVSGGTVASGGTDRVDNFTVVATVVPEPSTVALVSAGLVGLLALRRRRS